MNVETFMRSIENVTSDDIINEFENIMTLYSLCNGVCGYDNIFISKTSSELASFNIKFETEEQATKLHEECNGLPMTIYDISYHITTELHQNIVHITLKTP